MFTQRFLQYFLLAWGGILGLASRVHAVPGATVDSTVLIFARDEYSASTASSGLEGYGIPFQTVLVPKAGINLPALTSSGTQGRYGGIMVMGAVSYDYDGSWESAITPEQWDTIHEYQKDFHVRMVRTDEYPGPNFGEFCLQPKLRKWLIEMSRRKCCRRQWWLLRQRC